jgi:hypothetical protein
VKRVITICLLFVFLLNALGFYGVFVGWQWKNSRDFNTRLEADNYLEQETRTFKVPLTLPYGVDSRDYERVQGEFTYEGEMFRLVKQRMYRDTLYLVCVKDVKSTEINQALADYVKTFTDKPESSKNAVKITFDFSKDFLSTIISVNQNSKGWERPASLSSKPRIFLDTFATSVVHPPERA